MAVRFVPGGVLKLSLSSGSSAYAVMLGQFPYFAFYSADVALEDLHSPDSPPLFIIAVQRSAYSRGRWGRMLFRIRENDLPPIPPFFRQDVMDPSHCEIVGALGETRTVAPVECVGLERSAVWSAGHIEGRIEDHYAGRANAFAESMRVKL